LGDPRIEDKEKATEYAEKYCDLNVKFEQSSPQDRSKARHTLAVSRLALLKTYLPLRHAQLRSALDHGSLYEKRGRCLKMASTEVTDLEKWIQTG
jgi:hypothetical protein